MCRNLTWSNGASSYDVLVYKNVTKTFLVGPVICKMLGTNFLLFVKHDTRRKPEISRGTSVLPLEATSAISLAIPYLLMF